MNALSTKESVKDFLKEVKQTMVTKNEKYDTWDLVHRSKNMECLTELGFTIPDMYNTILSLSVSNYCDGPTHDLSEKGDFWVFGKIIEGKEVYIKLKLAAISIIKKVRIISFHIAEEAMCYPLLEKETNSNGKRGDKGALL
jgi:hypothetical protein